MSPIQHSRMCGSRASRHTMSGGHSPSGKVASLSSDNRAVMFNPSSIRVKIPGNPGTLGLGAVSATPSMVLQVCFTGDRVGAVWKVGVPRTCDGEVGKAGAGAGGNVIACCILVLVVPAWHA